MSSPPNSTQNPQPLIYPKFSPNFVNVLFIDSQVINYQQVVDSTNDSTFPVVYSMYSQKTDVLELLQTHFTTTIQRIGMFFTSSQADLKFFLDEQPLFLENENPPYIENEPLCYSENVQFILDILSQYQVQNIDYLACDTLNYANWNYYYDLLKFNTTAIIGASSDKTGNIYAGGDWVLENTNEDIEMIYFTSNIQYYQYLLDNISWASSTQGLNNPVGLIIDPTNTFIYASGNGNISKITLSNPSSYTASWTTLPYTYEIIMNSTNSTMYSAASYSRTLFSFSISEPSTKNIFRNIGEQIFGIVIDSTDTYLYVTTDVKNMVYRITIADPDSNVNYEFASSTQGLNSCKAIAINSTNTYIYVSNTGNNTISKISTSNPTTDFNATWASSIQGLNSPYGLVIDSTDTYMYVVNNGNNTVIQISMATPTTYQTFATNSSVGLFNPIAITIDKTNTYIYVSNQTGGGNSQGTISQIPLPVLPTPSSF